MSTIVNILIGVLIFSVIIIVHELGHLLLAKKNGISVPEFSIGMGPRLCSFKKGETRYSVKLFLIGGACQMLGEDEDSDDERAFPSKGVWARFSVIFAGPFFNFVLAFVLSIIVISIVGYDPAVVTQITENGAAQQAGLQKGDIITSFDGTSISIGRELATYFTFKGIDGTPVEVEYERDGEEYTTILTPAFVELYRLGYNYNAGNSPAKITSIVAGQPLEAAGLKAGDVITAVDGNEIKSGTELSSYLSENPLNGNVVKLTYTRDGVQNTVDVTPALIQEYSGGFRHNTNVRVKTSPLQVIKYSFIEIKYWIVTTVKSVGKLITGNFSANDIGGPVRIVQELGNTVEFAKNDGMLYIVLNLINWAILLSANIGVMNLLPIPALDGGRLVFILLEAVRGKPIDREKEGLVHAIGLILMLVLMVVVFFNDIRNVFF